MKQIGIIAIALLLNRVTALSPNITIQEDGKSKTLYLVGTNPPTVFDETSFSLEKN